MIKYSVSVLSKKSAARQRYLKHCRVNAESKRLMNLILNTNMSIMEAFMNFGTAVVDLTAGFEYMVETYKQSQIKENKNERLITSGCKLEESI